MENKSQKYILDVAPITRLPLVRQQFFSYLSNQDLSKGTLVSVPLFRREVEGVVLDSRPDFQHSGGYQLKYISRVLGENFLTEQQLNLAEQLSKYYLTSLGVVLKHFIPKRVIARPSTIQLQAKDDQKKNITLTPQQQNAVDLICEAKSEHSKDKFLLFGPSSSGKTEVYIHSILKIRKTNSKAQFLILLPELTLAPQAIERYQQYFKPEEITILHSKLGKGTFYSNWQKIQSGEAKIIIATRIGVFAPFSELGLIVIDEEQDMSYKQWDMNPRYDARQTALMLGENFQCPVVYGTATPRIETFYKASDSNFELIQLPVLPSEIMGRSKLLPDIEIVDMRKERWTDFGKKKANFSILSNKLQAEINYALSNNLQSILFVNHQGMNSFSVCSNCKEVLKCPKCDRALVYDESGIYKCLHCSFVADIIPSCKKCGNLEFRSIGIGTQGVVREIKKLFPNARACRIDTATIKKPGTQEEVYKQFLSRKIDILIGTQMITKGWDNNNVGLIGVIDADSLFSTPDFLTDERAYCHLMQITGRTGRVGSKFNGQAIIQTFNPQNIIFSFVQQRNYIEFYQKEIIQRQSLSYPPFGKIIKLTIQETDANKAIKEADKIHLTLKKMLAEQSNLRLTEPSQPLVSNIRGKKRVQIILKNTSHQITLPLEVIKVISSLSSSWIVDVDPISIA